jgi:hypothetical protein
MLSLIESEPLVRVFSDIDEEHKAVTALIAMLTIDQLSRRPDGQWSAIDLLTHLTAWQAHALTVARQQAAPDAPDLDPALGAGRILGIDADADNAATLAANRDITLDQALARYNETYAALRAALVTLPPARLLGGPGPHGTRIWFVRPALLHSREHRQAFQQRLGLG